MTEGYSGTPLARKLGVKDAQRTWRYHMPKSVADEIEAFGVCPKILRAPAAGLEMVHLFVIERSDFSKALQSVRPLLEPAGVIWVSWPKKAAKVATDITEDVVRAEAFKLGLVDIKVCAVDATWTGLKLVIRKAERVKGG
jgi:hypothetical protein